MELRSNIDFYQILGLIRQLSEKEKKELAFTLQSEIASEKSSEGISELLLNAPTWNDSDFKAFQESRIHINKSRIARFCSILLY